MPERFVVGRAPGRLPLVGHAVSLLFQPLDFLRRLPAHGDLVQIKLGVDEAYVPCRPALFRQVLKDARLYDKGGLFYERGREAVGNGLVTCRWADHQRQRPLMQPSFDHSHLSWYAELMADEVSTVTQGWRSGDVIDVDRTMATMALRITTRSLFSVPADHQLVAQVERWLPVLMNGFYRRMLIPSRVLSLVPTKPNREYPRAIRELRALTAEFIEKVERRGGSGGGLLSALLDAYQTEGGESRHLDEIFDQVLILLIAGTETTATALAFTFHLLGRRSDVSARIRDEAESCLADRALRFEDISNLVFTRQVVMESLRLYPPAWMFTRAASAACELGGREFPEGTTFLLSPYILHYDPELFPEPARFDPDRWRPDGMSTEARRSVLPFGSGTRKCIGDQFALTEMTLVLALIAARWDLRPLVDRPLRPTARATLKPGRLPMTVRERRQEPIRTATTADSRD